MIKNEEFIAIEQAVKANTASAEVTAAFTKMAQTRA